MSGGYSREIPPLREYVQAATADDLRQILIGILDVAAAGYAIQDRMVADFIVTLVYRVVEQVKEDAS